MTNSTTAERVNRNAFDNLSKGEKRTEGNSHHVSIEFPRRFRKTVFAVFITAVVQRQMNTRVRGDSPLAEGFEQNEEQEQLPKILRKHKPKIQQFQSNEGDKISQFFRQYRINGIEICSSNAVSSLSKTNLLTLFLALNKKCLNADFFSNRRSKHKTAPSNSTYLSTFFPHSG